MAFLIIKKLGLINLNHVREIHKTYCGLRIVYVNGGSREIQLPSGIDVDALLEELSLQIVKSQIVDFDSLLERFQTCGHKNRSAVCGHNEPAGPAAVDTDSAAGSVDTKEDVHRVDADYVEVPKTQMEVEEICRDDETDYKNLIWYDITDRICYAYDEERNTFILAKKIDEQLSILKKYKYEDLKKIWDALPEESTADDVRHIAKSLGIRLGGNFAYYLMRVFRHVKFGGDIKTRKTSGHPKLVLVKPDDDYLSEEVRRRLKLEMDVIGKVDSYGGV